MAAFLKSAMQIERRYRAAGPLADSVLQRDEDHGTVILFDQSGRDDSDDPRMPVGRGEHDPHGTGRLAFQHRTRLGKRVLVEVLPAAIHLLELARDSVGVARVIAKK